MARVCDISAKKTFFGNKVSHANNKNKRRFYPNLQKKSIYLPQYKIWLTLKLSTSVLRTINKNGINAVLKKYRLNNFPSLVNKMK